MTVNTERYGVYMTKELNVHIRQISNETGIMLNNVCLITLYGLVANYKQNGIAIFGELLKLKNEEN